LLQIVVLINVLPFLLGTLYSFWRTLWFLLAATAINGTVVEISNDELPALVVAYEPSDGTQIRIQSDGSHAYDDVSVGDTIRVLYDPDSPQTARLDLFLELWLGPIIMAGLSGLICGSIYLIARFLKGSPG